MVRYAAAPFNQSEQVRAETAVDEQTTTEREQERLTRARRLLEILQLERIEENLYRGLNEARGNYRLFGGQVLSQALRAACETVTDRQAHSVHGYFMRAGDAALPVLYEVDRIRDGRSFTTRRVVAIQEGRAIFSMSVSFQVAEEGFEHAASMPNVPPPEELEDDMQVAARLRGEHPNLSPMAGRPRPFETRSVFEFGTPAWEENRLWNPVWIRFAAPLPKQEGPDDDTLARCLLAYASDMGLVSTSLLPHAESQPRDKFQMASLDHALWIHAPIRMDQWLLFHKHTTTASGARGLVHAAFYDAGGGLLASVTQEGLIREYLAPEAR
ncbi:MAG: acyl-CoA thioesterase II [Gammaproteobacteria bacterium]|jgi:acyl-CoA thioesterase-2|nr:MAG: acyl-CoA thioesterase II [Gammaproteobacteria bacterium]